MRVALKKLDGVETADVSLEKATADIRLKPGNAITLPGFDGSLRGRLSNSEGRADRGARHAC